ncbi:MAG: aspartyl protease family protein [Vicinamibacterales bacterium]
MGRGVLGFSIALMVAVTSAAISGDVISQSQSGEIQLQLGHEFFREGRFADALDAYQKALTSSAPVDTRAARSGVVQSALRLAEFATARSEGATLIAESPEDPAALALYGDTLWASGLFDEAESRYRDAIAKTPELARGLHGLARSLAARSQLDEALTQAHAALRHAPRDLEVHHTVGAIYERMRRFEEAAAAYTNYVNLLPNKDRSEKADWSRAEIKFLKSFGQRVPFDMDPGAADQIYTVDFRLVKDKIVVRAKVNNGPLQDFVVDTGAESTIVTRPTAQRLGITPVTYTLSAGVGNAGLRGLQLARIDSLELGLLKMRNVPALIKDPPMRNLPVKESESLSPLALGFSMVIDYRTKKIVFGRRLDAEPADFELPLRMHRLATVRGTVDGKHPANFVVDTGGEVISISKATASALERPEPSRRIALKVFGSSGWDSDAFLMPGVNLAFSAIRYENFPVVVLNLNAPSALLGFELGGIVGHRFLSKYRVGIDVERSVLRLKKL